MGHNIDLREFGLTGLKCCCGNDLNEEISELDMDCDLSSHNPMCFEIEIQCFNCEKETEFKFELVRLK